MALASVDLNLSWRLVFLFFFFVLPLTTKAYLLARKCTFSYCVRVQESDQGLQRCVFRVVHPREEGSKGLNRIRLHRGKGT